jgi:fibronectin-binding autotransporter adhesin
VIRAKARILRHRSIGSNCTFGPKSIGLWVLLLVLSVMFFYTRAYMPTRVMAATSSTLNFQARLMSSSGSLVPDGSYSIQFKLYTAASGGTNEWTETQPTVTVKNGYLSVQLGSVTTFGSSIDWSQEKWLTMNVNADGEMNPRIKLTAVPYSFRSAQADALTNGSQTLTADDLAQLGPATPQAVSLAIATLRINQTGAGGFLQLQQSGVDTFTLASNGDVVSAGSATFGGSTLTIGNATQSGGLVIHEGDGNTLTLQTGGQSGNLTFTFPTGYGSNGDCLKGNGSGILSFNACAGANSFVNGGNAFAGLATLGTTDSNNLQVITASTQAMLIDTSGNVRIGSGSPTEKLDVAGGVRVGNSTGTNAGTIRWNGTDFEGYNGTEWKSFTQGGGGNANASANFVSGLANVGANVTGVAVEMLHFTSATAVSNIVGETGFIAPADGSFRTCLVRNNANITGGTLRLRWRVNGVSVGADACLMNNTVDQRRQSATTIDAGVVTFSAGDRIGVAFDTTGLAPTTNDFTAYWSVEYNSDATGGGASTLQEAYDGSGSPALISTADGKDLQVNLNNATTDPNFLINILTGSTGRFAIQDNGTDAFSVTSSTITLSKVVTATAGINLSNSGITNAGSITGVGTNITGAGALTVASGGSGDLTLTSASGTTVLSSSTLRVNSGLAVDLNNASDTTLTLQNGGAGVANINLGDGGLQTAGTTRLTNAGALQNITGLTVTSGGASITGNIVLGSASSERLTINGQMLGASPLVFQGATDNGFATTIAVVDPTANNTITMPNASGILVLDSRAITAGTGLTGGGDLSTNRTLSLDINGLTVTNAINNSDTLAIYDGTGIRKITRSDFLQGLTSALTYQGTWDASTNTPSISDGTGVEGYVHVVSTSGTQNLGSGNIAFTAGDLVIHDGSLWERAPSGSAVASVFGRTGAVTAQSGDYTASQLTNVAAGNISSVTVQAAIDELDAEKLGSLNGISTTSQTFANDANITITSAGSTHTLGWSGQLSVARGGTGASGFTANGVVYGNNTGALQVTSAGTGGQVLLANASGVPSFTSLSGDATISDTGVLSISNNAVALGTDTVGDYIANLGSLTGLSVTGNSGEGSTPALSVIYGSTANTAVQGNTAITITAGTNLSGGGNITLGAGGTVTLNSVDDPTFSTSVTTPLLTNADDLMISTTGIGNNLILSTDGQIILSGFDCSTFDNGGVLTVTSGGVITCDNDDGGGGGGSLSGSGSSGRLPVYSGSTSLTNSWLLQDTSTLRLDSSRDFDIAGGDLQFAGTSVLTAAGELQNITDITASGTVTLSSLSAGGLVKADTAGALDIAIAGMDYELPLTFDNGLTRTGDAIVLGGALTALTDIELDGNNFVFSGTGNVGIGTAIPNYKLEVDGDIKTSGNLIEKSVTFTPTTAGWYRIATGINMMGGTIRISAPLYDNTLTDVELQYNVSGYGAAGSIQQTRFSSYNNGVVSAARTSTDGVATLYLDIFISNATAPQPITIYGYGPNQPAFIASPVVGAIAGGSNVNFLTLGQGFRSTQGAIFAESGGFVGIGTSSTPSALLSIGGTTGNLTIDAAGNLATSGTTRLTAAGALQNLTGISTTGGLVFNSFSGNAGLLKVDASGNVSVTTAGTDYEVPLTFGNGLSRSGNVVSLGGALTATTDIALAGNNLVITGVGTIGLGTDTPLPSVKLDVRGSLGVQADSYSFIGTAAGLNTYGYFRAVNTADTTGYFELGSYDIAGASQGGRALVLNSLGGNVGVGGDLTPDGLFSVGSTSQFQVSSTGGVTAVGISSAGALISLNENSNFNTNINTGSSTGTVTIGGGNSPLIIDTPNLDFDSTNGLSVVGRAQFSTRTYVPGTSGTTGQGYFTGSIATPLSAFQSLDLAGNTYSFFATNKYYNGSAWVDNGLGRVGSSFQMQNDNFTFYSFDTAANFTPRFTVASGGNVGIGTSGVPSGLLSIGGSTGNFTVDGSGNVSTLGTTRLTAAGALQNVTGNNTNGVSFDANTITSGLLPVLRGGTGAGSFTTNGVIFGNNTGTLQVTAAGTGGQVLIANGSGVPTFTSLSGDVAISSSGLTTIGANTVALGADTTGSYVADITIQTGGGLVVSGTGSETATATLTIRRDCSNNQIVKWSTAGSGAWNCANDNTGISDVRVKNNVATVDDNVFDKLKLVRVVEFDFDCASPAFSNLHCNTNHQAGVIAQELELIFPELVFEDNNGYKNVRYDILGFYNMRALGQLGSIISANGDAKINNLQTGGIQRLTSSGQLQNINGLSIVSGGASITGGINNNSGGLTNVGSIAGATTINATGVINTSGSLQTGSVTRLTGTGALQNITTINASGNINTSGLYQHNGVSGASFTCSGNERLQGANVSGGIITSGACQGGLSDARLKENVVALDDSILRRIKDVNTVNFDFACDSQAFRSMNQTCDKERQAGVIAQELAQIFPELVYQNDDGYYRVKYDALNIYTLKATSQIAQKIDDIENGSNNATTISTNGTVRINENGQLQNINGLRMTAGGVSVVGGINNNNSGIIEAGNITGVSELLARRIVLSSQTNEVLVVERDGRNAMTIFQTGALELMLDDERAFAARRASGEDVFSISTSGGLVQVGSAASDASSVLLVLDNIDMEGDPPGINGAQYYNLRMQRFRCFQDGAWQNCISNASTEYVIVPQTVKWQQPHMDQEFPGEPRVWADLNKAQDFRITMQIKSQGASYANCYLQYAMSDSGPWQNLAQPGGYMDIDETGNLKSDWAAITPEARAEVLLRLMCRGGNFVEGDSGHSATPVFNSVRIHAR